MEIKHFSSKSWVPASARLALAGTIASCTVLQGFPNLPSSPSLRGLRIRP